MLLLVDFLMRLSFGLCVGMALTPHSKVTSGYYRNHLYVVLGLSALAALLSRTAAPGAFWWAATASALSYFGSVLWLYEKPAAGKTALVIVALLSLGGTLAAVPDVEDAPSQASYGRQLLGTPLEGETLTADEAAAISENAASLSSTAAFARASSKVTSALLLGITMAAMLLGHWYLNTPTMELAPLRRLLVAIAAVVALHALVSGLGLAAEVNGRTALTTQWMLFVALRWAFGLIGVAILTWMTWETLRVPNTQSATGILYVAVIGTFVGETMSILLSAESLFPL